ncbi:MAG: TolC family protein, partial [Pseudomonadota bacterium]
MTERSFIFIHKKSVIFDPQIIVQSQAGASRRSASFKPRLLPALACFLMLNGCAMTISRAPPPTVQQVDAATGYVFDLSPAETEADASHWWQSLGGAELDRLVTELQTQSLSIAAAEARVDQARALTRVARAERLPGVSATVDGGGQRGNAFVPGLSGSDPEWSELYRAALNADWDLDIFGVARAGEQAARLRANSTALASAALRQSLTAELVRGYVNAWTLKQQLELNRAIVAGFERTAELTDQRYRAGSRTASLLDVQIARQNAGAAGGAWPALKAKYQKQLNEIDMRLGKLAGDS